MKRIIRNNIYRLCGVLLLALAALPARALAPDAQLRQDATGSYYLISSADDLYYLMTHTALWADGNRFLQTADIDMAGYNCLPIGHGNTAFAATYNGDGRTIVNATFTWDKAKWSTSNESGLYSVYGLFGYVKPGEASQGKASIENLNLHNIHITRTIAGARVPFDTTIGILCGEIGSGTIIRNISVSDSRIDDGGADVPDASPRSLYVGGLVGQLLSAHGSYEECTATISNVFVNTDIDISNTSHNPADAKGEDTDTSKKFQFHVGGIIGRIRKGDMASIPVDAVFSGSINAPISSVGPIYGKGHGSTAKPTSEIPKWYLDGYAGEMPNGTPYTAEQRQAISSRAKYWNYRLCDNKQEPPAFINVSDVVPSKTDTKYGTRTIGANTWSADGKSVTPAFPDNDPHNNREIQARFQGVNVGGYAAEPANFLDLLNSNYAADPDCDYTFRMDPTGQYAYIHIADPTIDDLSLTIIADGEVYTAHAAHKVTGLGVDPASGHWEWYQAPDPFAEVWGKIAETQSITVEGQNYYKVRWVLNDGTYLEAMRGPYTKIYVYDRAGTIAFMNTYGARYPELLPDFDPHAFPDGDNNQDGRTPFTAVRDMRTAYSIALADSDWDSNQIVVIGYLNDGDYLMNKANNLYYGKSVTVTGTDNVHVFGGVLAQYKWGKLELVLQAPLRFRDLNIFVPDILPDGKPAGDVRFYCNGSDFEWGERTYLYNCPLLNDTMGQPKSLNGQLPGYTVVGGIINTNDPAGVTRSPLNKDPNRFQMTFLSGCIGRVISASRNDSNLAHTVYGSPDHPNRVKVTINIPQGTWPDGTDYNIFGYRCAADGTVQRYAVDIGLVVGGQTDGSCWSDSEIELVNGRVGRMVGGSITYGRMCSNDADPADSFFGRSIINIYGGEVCEIYGGSLGRHSETSKPTDKCNAFFYGTSQINMYAGRIGRYQGSSDKVKKDMKDLDASIYGCGAGGIMGIGRVYEHFTPENEYMMSYTPDPKIPFQNLDGSIGYSSMENMSQFRQIPAISLYDGTTLDITIAEASVNLYGGVVEGNIYAGGYGYSDNLTAVKAWPQVGSVYGNTSVTMRVSPDGTYPVVMGNVYGAGMGSDNYAKEWNAIAGNPQDGKTRFGTVACQFGDSRVVIRGGIVYGDVFGGGCGMNGFPYMATLYGDSHLTIADEADIRGNVYGGAALSNIKSFLGNDNIVYGGNTYLKIDGGTIGDCVFGGSYGAYVKNEQELISDNAVAIDGDTHLTILRGSFSTESLKTLPDGSSAHKNFNIYGGGYHNCLVKGDTHIDVSRSLLTSEESISDTYLHIANFEAAWNDLLFRRFCLYGGGYGAQAEVIGATNVNINIEQQDVLVDPFDGLSFYSGKQFFDVAGGGYSGNVGEANLTIAGNAFIRKVIGGGFYGSVRTTANTNVLSGVIHWAVGGGLMGYIHESSHLTIGRRTLGLTGEDLSEAEWDNKTLWIVHDVYGGNDVQGIVGTALSSDPEGRVDTDPYHISILYKADVEDPDKGAWLNIYGGDILGDVYGAGNGYYRGYYVPGWGRYMDGPDRFYRNVPARVPSKRDIDRYPDYNRVYKIRPMVGRVSLNIQGNSETDRVQIHGKVFGGGNACTIGSWIPELQIEDPRRLNRDGAGNLSVNIGSHVTVYDEVHMGSRGTLVGHQTRIPTGANVEEVMNFDEGVAVPGYLLDTMGDTGYDHWYFDGTTYKLGFPEPGPLVENPYGTHKGQDPDYPDKSFFLTGRHQFYGFMKFIEMNGSVNLTFLDEPYDAAGHLKEADDDAEVNLHNFDASDIRLRSFYLGGERGFMTHDRTSKDRYAYDLCIPYGVTIEDKLVCGGKDTYLKYYRYNADCTDYEESDDNLLYSIRGGLNIPSYFGDIYDSNNNILPLKVTKEGDTVYADIVPGTRESDYAIRMTCTASFEPLLDPDAPVDPVTGEPNPYARYGGLVFGGCYNSGIVQGDVVLNISSNLINLPDVYNEDTADMFGDLASLKYNVGRVFGGGFGTQTVNEGNTHIYLLRNFKGFNVFGGGMQGTVDGSANVVYVGTENSYVYGSIYGGGLVGSVGRIGPDNRPLTDAKSTNVQLISGNVSKVYGGGCLSELFGGTYVYLTDRVTTNLPHLDWSKLDTKGWGEARLIAGSVYGGSDIAGHIYTKSETAPTTYVHMTEMGGTAQFGGTEIGKDTPGSHEGYNGFPLVGWIYGGSNADYGTHNEEVSPHNTEVLYTDDTLLTFATGTGAGTQTLNMKTARKLDGSNFVIPIVHRTKIEIEGGTAINVYGGGRRSTVAAGVDIKVNYADTIARAGFEDWSEVQRYWNVMNLQSEVQATEVLRPDDNGHYVYGRQIYRLFGGNNIADMVVQPRWELLKGYVGSVYSGGNIGRMTYYNPDANPNAEDVYLRHKGLTIAVNSPDIRIDAIYGGGRMGNIIARTYEYDSNDKEIAPVFGKDEYGTNVYIHNGVIDNVYGGNDVLGEVLNGTNVNVYGAISGNVYGAGNGNYLYKYDEERTTTTAKECFDETWGRYFLLPRRTDFAVANLKPEQKIIAINHFRPNVERTRVNIEGSEASPVYIRGNVFCGGNSATISSSDRLPGELTDVRFNIGSHVIINGVFLGSNGTDLVKGETIYATEQLNNIPNIAANNTLEYDDCAPDDKDCSNKLYYPNILTLYMRAVEVSNTPDNFRIDPNLTKAYIGDFCVGGNHGSMVTNRPIQLTFPESLVIYRRIVGGCFNTNVTYRGVTARGGMTRQLADEYAGRDKLELEVKCQFKPLFVKFADYPLKNPTVFDNFYVNADGQYLDAGGDYIFYEPDGTGGWKLREGVTEKKYYPDETCNIYGGCYQSGTVVGNITVHLHSDMLDYTNTEVVESTNAQGHKVVDIQEGSINKRAIVDGVDDFSWRTFDVYGGGYGRETKVFGNIIVRLRPAKLSTTYVEGVSPAHPSCSAIFGGSKQGLVVGKVRVEVCDGTVLTNVYGASEAAKMYGSTMVMVGFPDTYTCTQQGEYQLKRADDLSGMADKTNADGTPVIPQTIKYLAPEPVPVEIYNMIVAADPSKASCFFRRYSQPMHSPLYQRDEAGNVSETYPLTWNDIEISIGDPYSHKYINAPYYGHGGVYGGGFLPVNADESLAGKPTLMRYTDEYNQGAGTVGYGGNSAVLVWDNYLNGTVEGYTDGGKLVYDETDRPDNTTRKIEIRDHISISTGHYVPKTLHAGQDVKGTFKYNPTTGEFNHQASKALDADNSTDYFTIESDGGIYGDGRKVWVQGIRHIELTGYGYADHTPQQPKLLNTFQRADILKVQDCTLMLNGASDFATNKVDATTYSINRIGELKMVSSIPVDGPFVAGTTNPDFEHNILHNVKRSRNYIAFFHQVNYLGAIESNVAFDGYYHDESGHMDDEMRTYVDVKHERIKNRETNADGFEQRNVATAANMIGINNGYSLRVQGCRTTRAQGATEDDDNSYYGPIKGVVEIKLLTLSQGEGGGYVFALNQHDTDLDKQDFLEVSGNFVFPGAAYLSEGDKYNYIIDDCVPLLHGYDAYKSEWTGAADEFNVNDPDHGGIDVHYWYVNGQKFFYNLTLTAYTSENEHKFWLDNSDGLVMLNGTTTSSDIKVKSISWQGHYDTDIEGYDCALTDLGEDYKLFLTIDKDVRLGSKEGEDLTGAYIREMTRADYSYDTETNTVIANGTTGGNPKAGSDVNPNAGGAFGNKTPGEGGVTVANTPSVGFRLEDRVDNSDKDYYVQRLKDPHNVIIVLEATDASHVPFEYTLDLTIRYLRGPQIKGHPLIANCALPGEIIYATAEDVVVELDREESEIMTVSERTWQLVPRHADGTYSDELVDIRDFMTPGNEKEVRIPAYYYQDGWKVRYAVKVNGEYFYADVDPEAEHTTLMVHNYHRMNAFDGVKTHDLKLCTGARVYLEDEDDFTAFFNYLRKCQDGSIAVPTPSDKTINPQYCEGVLFYLQDNLTLPSGITPSGTTVFKGTFNGNGHVFTVPNGTTIPFENKGQVVNTGFYSENNNDDTIIFNDNDGGTLTNCYYYNKHNKGTLCSNGTAVNCYQNTRTDNPEFVSGLGLLQVSSDAFHNGLVAYNLNSFYLQRRDNLLRSRLDTTYATMTVKKLDRAVRDDNSLIPYIEFMFNNGDYRYAYVNAFGQFTEALRTAAIPNYDDMMGSHGSHHDTTHPRDQRRWDEESGLYLPDYKFGDYIFFGQDLTMNADPDDLPTLFTENTRVYRAGGFYGSMVDKGFYFNKDVYVRSELLTAIDFNGYNDQWWYADPDSYGRYHQWVITPNPALSAPKTGFTDHDKYHQEIFFPPTLDLPRDEFDDIPSVASFQGIADGVTKNLLIYGSNYNPMCGACHYQDNVTSMAPADLAVRGAMPQDVRAHHIVGTNDWKKPVAYAGKLHLYDGEDFNCPIEFDVKPTPKNPTAMIWYNRLPAGFSNGTRDKSAWEGICLPFTARKVFAATTSDNATRNHGEVTHFYDDDTKLHEYWLRRFEKEQDGDLMFERPRAENEDPGTTDEIEPVYSFTNTYFLDAFSNFEYQQNHDLYNTEHRFEYYRYLTGSIPYIISFPGERYYEFDMSGKFFAEKQGQAQAYQQIICYMEEGSEGHPVIIPVTDENPPVVYEDSGHYAHCGTFMHLTADSANYAVLNEVDSLDPEDQEQNGTWFQRVTTPTVIEPFHTYIMMPSPSPAPMHIRASVHEEEKDLPHEEDLGEEIGSQEVIYFVDGRELVIDSPLEDGFEVQVVDTLGRVVRTLWVEEGENRYDGFEPGIYIAGSFKFTIK